MSVLDLDQLLQDVAPDAPCGADPEYDPAFLEMEREAQGRPEQQMGDQVIAAVPPNWKAVKDKAGDLFTRCKDLRVAAYYCRSLLCTDGLPGLAAGLTLIARLVQDHWDQVHPVLDPDDGNDPVMRINALAALGDRDLMVAQLRETPLVRSRALGAFSRRDLEIASGQVAVPADMENPPESSHVEAAFMDADLEELGETAAAVAASLEATAAIASSMGDKSGQRPTLDDLDDELQRIQKILQEQLQRRGAGSAAQSTDGAAAQAAAPANGGVPAARPAPPPGEVSTRSDVVRVLDKVIEYYRKNEPTSPVPLLIERAKGLVHKDFMDIIRDLAPEAVAQVEKIRGAQS